MKCGICEEKDAISFVHRAGISLVIVVCGDEACQKEATRQVEERGKGPVISADDEVA